MNIQKFEQSGFVITSSEGFRVAVDVAGLTPIESLDNVSVDAVLVSHKHGDHFSVDHINALQPVQGVWIGDECQKQESWMNIDEDLKVHTIAEGEVEIGPFKVQIFQVDHGPNATQPLLENFGFLIREGGKSIYFTGDMYTPSGISTSDLSVDLVMVPVGGHYTFDAYAAYDFVQSFAHIGKVIPMHYEEIPNITPANCDAFTARAQDHYEVRVLNSGDALEI